MTAVFERLQINGYRGLTTVELTGLGQVNILVGNNNSGKTSLLEAISILCNPLDPFQWLEVAQRRSYIGRSPVILPRLNIEPIKWIFPQTMQPPSREFYQGALTMQASGSSAIAGIEAKLDEIYGTSIEEGVQTNGAQERAILSYTGRQAATEETVDDAVILTAETDAMRVGVELAVIANLRTEQLTLFAEAPTQKTVFHFWENERFVQRRRSEAFVNSAMISPAYSSAEPLVNRLTQIIKEEIDGKRSVLALIQEFDNNILDLQILSLAAGRAVLFIEHKELGFAPLYVFGDGLKKTLMLALTLLTTKNGVLLIDEIETSIHVSALTKVFSWLVETCRRQHTQLFVTTHSLEAIDAMLQTEIATDDLVAFRLNARNQPPQRFSGNLLHRLRAERGLDVR